MSNDDEAKPMKVVFRYEGQTIPEALAAVGLPPDADVILVDIVDARHG